MMKISMIKSVHSIELELSQCNAHSHQNSDNLDESTVLKWEPPQ
jgi:hypothetical protein